MLNINQHNPRIEDPLTADAFRSSDYGVNLPDLPNELLIDILSVLSPRDIFSASLLSRRFLHLALPLFLASHGIKDPEHELSIYVLEWNPNHVKAANQPDALSGLGISTTISKVNHFRCFFQDLDPNGDRNSFQQALDLPHAVRRVSRFVQRLKYVGTAEIYLMWDPYFVTRERSASHVHISEIRKWTNSFGYLLNLLVVRGCTSLTVQYDPTIERPFHFRSANGVKRAFSYLSHNIFKRDNQASQLQWEFQGPLPEDKLSNDGVDPPVLPSIGQVYNRINSLSIHSPALLLPPFTNWTLSLLRSHPHLTSISFAYISISKDIWSTVLPFIADAAGGKLTRLSFFRNCPNLEATDLLHFIGRFSNLRYLSVDRTFRPRLQEIDNHKSPLISPFTSNGISLLSFPHLHTLHAPAELISLLLDARPTLARNSSHPPLPQLKDLTVYPSSRLIHPPSYITSSLAVNSLLNRVVSQPREHEVDFSLDAQMEFTDFGPVTRYIESINTRGEFRRSVWETLSQADIQQLTKDNNIPLIAFVRVTHLLLYRFNVRYADQTPAALCLWIKILFPNLRRLTFTCQQEAYPRQEVRMEEGTIEALIKELRAGCPDVRNLVVGNKLYQL
ncbi:hypothetical protein GALMADRAFT_271088 [Galerina marginata CBS 339.88]|uniref:F-box domain-containing protein n=1 Tax=Galerina marginata (strain CBS 339.88) TaxID=685588 RepID=A0A067SNF3_GALM3|nr:hypothetical protein GALMADRAFT_271088 [Galerina marginata CBS 339.88]